MRITTLFFIAAVALTACNQKPTVDTAKEEQALLATDKNFCTTEQQQGMGKAIEKFYDNDVVAISPNRPVNVGKATVIKDLAESKMDTMNALSWSAEKAAVSAFGDLGYVWGRYTFKAKTKEGADTIYYGAYVTVYKKAADGAWKAVVDQNSDTPKP